MWDAGRVADVPQVQRAKAAMSVLPDNARLEGLLWYQVSGHP